MVDNWLYIAFIHNSPTDLGAWRQWRDWHRTRQEAEKIVEDVDFINTTLLLSQGKSWIDNEKTENFTKVFSCENSNDIIGEFLFLISNLYSSEDNFEKSNFYLNLSNFINPKFIFNLSWEIKLLYKINNIAIAPRAIHLTGLLSIAPNPGSNVEKTTKNKYTFSIEYFLFCLNNPSITFYR